MLRRRLGGFLLVLYVAAVYGLPALHLARHRNDHVHELGGLRWIRPPAAHVHGASPRQEAQELLTDSDAPDKGPRYHLRAAPDGGTTTAAPHLGIGPAHGTTALLAPLYVVATAPAAQSYCLALVCTAPSAGELASQHRARAPPLPV